MNVSYGSSRLNIELGSLIYIQFPPEDRRFPFYLIGMDVDSTLIVKPQPAPQLNKLIFDGVDVVARYLYAGKAVGFRSHIQAHTTRPCRIVYLEYPQQLESMNLRMKERIYCYLPAQLAICTEKIEGMIIDLSEGGCRWICHDAVLAKEIRLTIDSPIRIIFALPGDCDVLLLDAVVRNVIQETAKYQIGMAFTSIDAESLKKVERYVGEARKIQQNFG